MAAGQVRGLRAGLRPVAGSRPDMRRELALGHRPAARALLRLRHVLGDLRLRGRPDIGDLMPPRRRHRLAGQARAAAAARRRRAVIALIRVIEQAHRHPGITRLLTRPPLPPLPQRPIRGPLLLLMRAIGGRRARGRGRVLARRRSSSSTRAESRSFSAVSRSTCPVSSAISRYAPASRTASPAAGSADSSSAEGRPGTADTTGNDHHSSPPINNAPRRVTPQRHDLVGHDRPRDPAPRCDRALRSLTQ